MIGLVDVETLKPGDLVGVNKVYIIENHIRYIETV